MDFSLTYIFDHQVAVGRREKLLIFGSDYNTVDGTGVRDYIHVMDLAAGHVHALSHLKPGCQAYNLGTGHGYSVLEVLHAFEQACGRPIPYQTIERRAGDVAESYSDANLAKEELGWAAKRELQEMCEDAWRWQLRNPNGFQNNNSIDH